MKIVSIDLGIKNISICQFLWNVPTNLSFWHLPRHINQQEIFPSTKPTLHDSEGIDLETENIVLKYKDILDSFASQPLSSLIDEAKIKTHSLQPPIVFSWERLDMEDEFFPGDISKYWQRFGPDHIAYLANELIQKKVISIPNMSTPSDFKHMDTIVLLEHQRFRSSSSHIIPEWTLRINMLETALYTALQNDKNLIPYGILPRRVMSYWKTASPDFKITSISKSKKKRVDNLQSNTEENLGAGEKTNGQYQTYKNTKQFKTDIAACVIEKSSLKNESNELLIPKFTLKYSSEIFNRANEVLFASSNLSQKYCIFQDPASLGKTDKTQSFQVVPRENDQKGIKMIKADDLADSLIQGLAWVNWQSSMWTLANLCSQNKNN